MTTEFQNLLDRLQQAEVDFVIVGGFAAMMHGSSLMTQDIDVCCDFSPDNLMRLMRALSDIHPVHRMTPNKVVLELTAKNCANLKNLYLDTDQGVLDCLSEVAGVGDFKQVRRVSQELEAGEKLFYVLSLDALIDAKTAINRPQDQLAVNQLKIIRGMKNSKSDS